MNDIPQRIFALRERLGTLDFDAWIVPRADEYLGEYIPERHERLRWISGFTGSAGLVIITSQQARAFVDGRYTEQVREQVPSDVFSYGDLDGCSELDWLCDVLHAGARVGYDPRLHSVVWMRSARQRLTRAGMTLIEHVDNPIDSLWLDRPEAAAAPMRLLPEIYTGEFSVDKRSRVAAKLRSAGADQLLVFAIDALAWLLNTRGSDVPCTPVTLAMGLLDKNGSLVLLVDQHKVPREFAEHVGPGVYVQSLQDAERVLRGCAGETVWVDAANSNAWSQLILEDSGAVLLEREDPVALMKACKNPVESDGMRRAHCRDAIAEVEFLSWLEDEVAVGKLHTEAALAGELLARRAPLDLFQGSSFPTISAAGSNAALPHYNFRNSDSSVSLPRNSLYLFDSGAQYLDGTTDVTRTVAIGEPTNEAQRMFTLVLKGHIALAQMRFPAGTTGTQLDALARQFLWRDGLDYGHGTGHGVGCFLSVHEGPQRIAKAWNKTPLLAGMVVSNEPGFYRPGHYGIRCENLLLVRHWRDASATECAWLEFETLTLVPFDRRLLDFALLTDDECDWLDRYHQKVYTAVAENVSEKQRLWLRSATEPLPRRTQ